MDVAEGQYVRDGRPGVNVRHLRTFMTEIKPARGNLYEVTVMVGAGAVGFHPTGLARLWVDRPE